MCSVRETTIPTGKSWEGTTLLRRGRGGKQKTGGSEYTHSIILAFPGHALGRLFSRHNRECCSGRAFCMRESKSRPEGGLGLGALGARCSIYIFTVMGSVNLKLRVDSAGSTISLLPV